MYAQKIGGFQTINKPYGLLITQLKDRVKLIKLEMKPATDEQDKLTDVMKLFSRKSIRGTWRRFNVQNDLLAQ